MWLQWCIHSSNIVRDIAIIECNVTQVALQNCTPFTIYKVYHKNSLTFGDHLKSHWLIVKSNINLHGPIIVFCLQQLVLIMIMLILIILVLLSKTQNYMPLQSSFQKKTIKNYQNFLGKDLKYQFIGMNIKHKVRIKRQEG